MRRAARIASVTVAALTLGLGTALVNAHPYGHEPGSGMGQGYGPGAGMGPAGANGAMAHRHMGHGPMEQGMAHGHMGHGPMPHGMAHGMGPRGAFNPRAMADARMAYLKSELNITPAQETSWKAFADQRKQQVEAMLALRASVQGSAQATAPERLELRSQMMKKRQEQMEKTAAAFRQLYAVLTPEQKALANQRVGMRGARSARHSRSGN